MLSLEQVEAAGGYSLIYADPPWSYQDGGRREVLPRYRGVENHYGTLSVQDLCLTEVDRLAAPDCVLALWATSPLILDALAVIKAWGFTYKTVGFAWVKTNAGDKVEAAGAPRMGLGRWTRSSMEPCLLATRGRPKRAGAGIHQTIITEDDSLGALLHPVDRLKHSEKPAEVRDRLVQLCGDVPRIELFARQRVEGWDCWGREAPGGSDVEMRA